MKIKTFIISFFAIGALAVCLATLWPGARSGTVSAAGTGGVGPAYNLDLSASKTSAQVGTPITVTAFTYIYTCADNYHYSQLGTADCDAYGGVSGKEATVEDAADISATGSGNTISPASIISDNNGLATFTITSTVAETKTITASNSFVGVLDTITVTFTPAPAPTPSTTSTPTSMTTSSTPKPASSPTVAPTPTEVAAPAAITPADIHIGGKPLQENQSVSTPSDKPLKLSGKTVPNATVTLYIFSTPRKVTVTADKDGNWSYNITGLPAGQHHVEAEVTDPVTGKTSARAKILQFAVTSPAHAIKQTTAATHNRHLMIYIAILATALALAATTGVWWWYRHKTPEDVIPLSAKNNP